MYLFTNPNKKDVYSLLSGLESYYPSFSIWLDKAIDTSTILGAVDSGRLVGVALGKQGAETKLQCVRVHPDYNGSGIGLRLIDEMLDLLGERKPLCTVSEEMLHSSSRAFVTRYGFSLDDVCKGMYRRNKLEYVFNRKG